MDKAAYVWLWSIRWAPWTWSFGRSKIVLRELRANNMLKLSHFILKSLLFHSLSYD